MTNSVPHERERFGSRTAFYFAAVGSGMFEISPRDDSHSLMLKVVFS